MKKGKEELALSASNSFKEKDDESNNNNPVVSILPPWMLQLFGRTSTTGLFATSRKNNNCSLTLSTTPYKDKQLKMKSFYIWGDVGQGKTMLMDAFYNSTNLGGKDSGRSGKTRVHFHKFMLDVQGRLHELRQQKEQQQSSFPGGKQK